MEKRVKEFFENDTKDLEVSINAFLKKTPGKLLDIKYQYLIDKRDECYATALVIYTPEEEKESPDKQIKSQNKKIVPMGA